MKCFSRMVMSSSHMEVGLSQLKFLRTLGLTTPSSPTFYPFKITSNCWPVKKKGLFPGFKM